MKSRKIAAEQSAHWPMNVKVLDNIYHCSFNGMMDTEPRCRGWRGDWKGWKKKSVVLAFLLENLRRTGEN